MKIQKILSQHRRDFRAVYECGHCGYTRTASGYDDEYFHSKVVPGMVCPECGKTGDPDPEHRNLAPRYPEDMVV